LIKEPERRFVALALEEVNPCAPFVAVMSPMMINVPVDELPAPADVAPAVTFPVIENVPSPELSVPEFMADPAVTFPVIKKVPDPEFVATG
jgi:hypothetical protein